MRVPNLPEASRCQEIMRRYPRLIVPADEEASRDILDLFFTTTSTIISVSGSVLVLKLERRHHLGASRGGQAEWYNGNGRNTAMWKSETARPNLSSQFYRTISFHLS